MAKIEPANLLLKDKNGNTGLVKSLTNKDITTLKNVVTNVNYIKDFVNANGGSLPVQGDLRLTATDAAGKNGKTLLGTSSGTLQWNGKNIVRSVNGTNADVNGNVAITSVANATNAENAVTSSKLQNARVLTINDTRNNLGAGVSFDGSKNVTIPLPPYIANQLLRDKTKNYGNDYYDDGGITSLIYAGNGSGTVRAELAEGNFERLHPGQYIRGKVTGTTYVVVGCNIYRNLSNADLLPNHLGLMPIQLEGNKGNLLWSGKTYAGSSSYNTLQGYAPWASDNNTEGKNQTSCYKDSYIANTVLPKVDNLWLKPDFENQGISVLTFRNRDAKQFDANATCMSNPNWYGCVTGWESDEVSRRLVLPSEPEIYGHYQWAGSPLDSTSQYTQLPLYRHKEIHKVFYGADIWLKDSASASYACLARYNSTAFFETASYALRVCPIFLIA